MNLKKVILPGEQDFKVYDVASLTTQDLFLLDYDRRGKFELKHKKQLRHGKDMLMVRMEINAPKHTNPDGKTISRNHIHIFKEGYEPGRLPWAYELCDIFPNLDYERLAPLGIFSHFCKFCNIGLHGVTLQGVI